MFTGNVSTKKISKSWLNCFGYGYIFFAKLAPSRSFGKKSFVHRVVCDSPREMSLFGELVHFKLVLTI